MPNIRDLLGKMAAQEAAFQAAQFIAPCVKGGRVRTRIAGLVQTFTPSPADFEGWGLFSPDGAATARLIETADLPLVCRYLDRLPSLRMRLAHRLECAAWLAYPVNESDAQQRFGMAKPIPVCLVTEGSAFEPIVARYDGGAWWFEEVDRRADPRPADSLKEGLRKTVLPDLMRFRGITPEMRVVYELAARRQEAFQALFQPQRDEARLRSALRLAGGELRDFRDQGDLWQVEWTTRDGERHTSAISKRDLTVVSSGICLSGRDRDFDLQSLVGVIEQRDL